VKSSHPVFVDTWGWLAYGHRRDAHHHAVKALLEKWSADHTPVHTSDYVLDELITLLFRRESPDEAQRFLDGLLADCVDLRKRYRDKPDISFTDFTTMAIMRELRIASILTEDNHFFQVGLGFQKLPP
jgi:uncharacterized protein